MVNRPVLYFIIHKKKTMNLILILVSLTGMMQACSKKCLYYAMMEYSYHIIKKYHIEGCSSFTSSTYLAFPREHYCKPFGSAFLHHPSVSILTGITFAPVTMPYPSILNIKFGRNSFKLRPDDAATDLTQNP